MSNLEFRKETLISSFQTLIYSKDPHYDTITIRLDGKNDGIEFTAQDIPKIIKNLKSIMELYNDR